MLSLKDVFEKRPEVLDELRGKMLDDPHFVAWRKAQQLSECDAEALLERPFVDADSGGMRFGSAEMWRRIDHGHFDQQAAAGDVASHFTQSPYVALAMFIEMAEQWAPTSGANNEPLLMTDAVVVDQVKLIGADKQTLMRFLGSRYRSNRRQAALGLAYSIATAATAAKEKQ